MRQLRLLLLCLPALALAACEREPALFLCDHTTSVGPERIVVDWARFLHKETPTGMTLNLFQRTDSGGYRLVRSTLTNDITHADYTLPAADYADYVFNQGDGEFGTASFSDLDDWQQASVNTTQAASRWYKDTVMTSPLVSEVEWIGTESHTGLPLTQAMLDSAAGGRITIDTLRPRNIVSTITVYVHIENIGSLRSARAWLNGLASGYWLGRGHTREDKVTQLLESWHLSIDSTKTIKTDTTVTFVTDTGTIVRTDSVSRTIQYGVIVAQISSFGLPYGHRAQPDENTVHLECLLKNDSVMRFDYPVGDKFEFDEDDNADLHFYIDITMEEPLPDVPDQDSESAFDVNVDNWDDEKVTDVKL